MKDSSDIVRVLWLAWGRPLIHKSKQYHITKMIMEALVGYFRACSRFFLLPVTVFKVSETTLGKAKQNIIMILRKAVQSGLKWQDG